MAMGFPKKIKPFGTDHLGSRNDPLANHNTGRFKFQKVVTIFTNYNTITST